MRLEVGLMAFLAAVLLWWPRRFSGAGGVVLLALLLIVLPYEPVTESARSRAIRTRCGGRKHGSGGTRARHHSLPRMAGLHSGGLFESSIARMAL